MCLPNEDNLQQTPTIVYRGPESRDPGKFSIPTDHGIGGCQSRDLRDYKNNVFFNFMYPAKINYSAKITLKFLN
jgi:hypothetical protein